MLFTEYSGNHIKHFVVSKVLRETKKQNMKTRSLRFIPILLTAAMIVIGCDDDIETTETVTSDEAADMAASALAVSSAGLVLTVENSTSVTDLAVDESTGGRIAACGYSKDSVFTKSNAPGSVITYTYSFEYSYSLSCSVDEPSSLTAGMYSSGEFDGTRLASANTSTADLVVAALDDTQTTYSVNGVYSREGSFQSKVRNLNSGTNTVTFTVDEIRVDKTTKEILSGTADLTITGTVTGKGTFVFDATITFNGNNIATLVINGTSYSVNLLTGDLD